MQLFNCILIAWNLITLSTHLTLTVKETFGEKTTVLSLLGNPHIRRSAS